MVRLYLNIFWACRETIFVISRYSLMRATFSTNKWHCLHSDRMNNRKTNTSNVTTDKDGILSNEYHRKGKLFYLYLLIIFTPFRIHCIYFRWVLLRIEKWLHVISCVLTAQIHSFRNMNWCYLVPMYFYNSYFMLIQHSSFRIQYTCRLSLPN